MAKHIGILAAVAFSLGTQGVNAASITDARLQELISSTSRQNVSLESLRSRDKTILEELARSLALRYGEILVGSEMVFTRMTDAGSIYYRLDFIGLRSRDHARALCEILEMDRCIAKIGEDRMTVLSVRTDPSVAALVVLEEDADPFDFLELEDPRPAANPRAQQIESRMRGMIDPLTVFPEPRPDFTEIAQRPAPARSAAPAAAPLVRETVAPSFVNDPAAQPVADDEAAPAVEDLPRATEPGGMPDEEDRSLQEVEAEWRSGAAEAPAPDEAPPADDAVVDMPSEAPSAVDTPVTDAGQIVDPSLELPYLEYPEDEEAMDAEPSLEVPPPAYPEDEALLEEMTPGVDNQPDAPGVLDPGPADPELPPADMEQLPAGDPQEDPVADQEESRLGGETDGAAATAVMLEPVPRTLALSTLEVRPAVAEARIPMPVARPDMILAAYLALETAVEQKTAEADVAMAVSRDGPSTPLTVNIPGQGDIDADAIRAMVPLKEVARPVVQVLAAPDRTREVPRWVIARKTDRSLPVPVARAAALAIDAIAPETETRAVAAASGEDIPEPLDRMVALHALAQAPEIAVDVADIPFAAPIQGAEVDIPIPDIEISVGFMRPGAQFPLAEPGSDLPASAVGIIEVAEVEASQSALLPTPLPRPDLLAADAAPDGESEIASAIPPDLTENIPEPDMLPRHVETSTPVLASRSLPYDLPDQDARRLGRVVFNDGFARPAGMDFNAGQTSGRLQKLPVPRPNLSSLMRSVAPVVLHEDGSVALVGSDETPFEIAQVPSAPSRPGAGEDAPFTLDTPTPSAGAAPVTALDRLLLEGDTAIDLTAEPELPVPPVGASLPAETVASPAAPVRPGFIAPPSPGQVSDPVAPVAAPAQATAPQTAAPAAAGLPSIRSDEDRAMAVLNEIMLGQDDLDFLDLQVEDQAMQPTYAQMNPFAPMPMSLPQLQQMQQAADPRMQVYQPGARGVLVPRAPLAQPGEVATITGFPGTSQRRPAPRGMIHGNTDALGAAEQAGRIYVEGDNRSPMAQAANPFARAGQPVGYWPAAVTPADLRVELAYVGTREEAAARAAELKAFFPALILERGRFFGAAIPEQPDRFMVGLAAHDLAARNEIIWYLEQMGIPWAMR